MDSYFLYINSFMHARGPLAQTPPLPVSTPSPVELIAAKTFQELASPKQGASKEEGKERWVKYKWKWILGGYDQELTDNQIISHYFGKAISLKRYEKLISILTKKIAEKNKLYSRSYGLKKKDFTRLTQHLAKRSLGQTSSSPQEVRSVEREVTGTPLSFSPLAPLRGEGPIPSTTPPTKKRKPTQPLTAEKFITKNSEEGLERWVKFPYKWIAKGLENHFSDTKIRAHIFGDAVTPLAYERFLDDFTEILLKTAGDKTQLQHIQKVHALSSSAFKRLYHYLKTRSLSKQPPSKETHLCEESLYRAEKEKILKDWDPVPTSALQTSYPPLPIPFQTPYTLIKPTARKATSDCLQPALARPIPRDIFPLPSSSLQGVSARTTPPPATLPPQQGINFVEGINWSPLPFSPLNPLEENPADPA